MFRLNACFVMIFAWASLAASSGSRAELVTWEFAGEVTEVYDPDDLLFGGMLPVGAPFSGTDTFDLSTSDSDPHPRRGI